VVNTKEHDVRNQISGAEEAKTSFRGGSRDRLPNRKEFPSLPGSWLVRIAGSANSKTVSWIFILRYLSAHSTPSKGNCRMEGYISSELDASVPNGASVPPSFCQLALQFSEASPQSANANVVAGIYLF